MEDRWMNQDDILHFREYLVKEERSEATVSKYVHDIRKFYGFLGQDRMMTKERIIDYKKQLLNEYTVSSANSMLAALNTFLEFMDLGNMKVRRYRVQKQLFCAEERELTKGEYIRLIHTSKQQHNERLSLIIQTICGTGIRVSELQHFTVWAVKRGKIEVNCKNKVRIVFVPDKLRKLLITYIKKNRIKDGPIFITRTGNPVNRTNIWREMKQLCHVAGVEPTKVFPHNLRHLFARTFYSLEKDITKLADVLGHTSIETTRIYVISTGREHKKRLSELGLIL